VGSLVGVALLTAAGIGSAMIGPLRAYASSTLHYYALGEIIDFRRDGDGRLYIQQGWGRPTAEGVRTIGAVADLAFPAHLSSQNGLWLTLKGEAFFAPDESEFWIDLLVNGRNAKRYYFRRGQTTGTLSVAIPYDQAGHGAPFHLTLVVGAAHVKPDAAASGFSLEGLSLK